MNSIRYIAHAKLAITTLLVVGITATGMAADQTARQSPGMPLLGHYETNSPALVVATLQAKPSRNYEDMIDYGTALLMLGRFTDAADVYESAARLAKNEDDLCGALLNKASAQAYSSLKDACRTIDLAARLRPTNRDVAELRLALYEKKGDELGASAAADQMRRIDPSYAGHEVCDPVTIGLIVTAFAISAYAIHDVAIIALVPPEDRSKLAGPVMAQFSRTTSRVLDMTSGKSGLGTILLASGGAE